MLVEIEMLLQKCIFNYISFTVQGCHLGLGLAVVRALPVRREMSIRLLGTRTCSVSNTYIRCETVTTEIGVFAGKGLNLL